jgi:RNA polymerase sigma factor (sigma-70 family)
VRAVGRATTMLTATSRAPFLHRARLGRFGDDRLAALAAGGDERAFEELYERHHRALLGFCRHLVGSREEGEDALQQTFLRVHRSLLAHGAPDEVRPWLFAIARNRCRTLLAARRPDAAGEDRAEPATDGLGAEVQGRADLRAVLTDVGRLPDDQRAALVLSELADLSHAEIGAVIGVPTEKVKALVYQARSRLIAERDARDTPCEDIRAQLAGARGGELRRGPLRRHLAACASCRTYRAALDEQRVALGLVLPVLPSAGLKAAVLGAISGGGGGAAAVSGLAGGATGGLSATLSGLSAGVSGLGVKLAVGGVLAAGAAGGGAMLAERSASDTRPGATQEGLAAPAAAPAATSTSGGASRPGSVAPAPAAPGSPAGAGRGDERRSSGRARDHGGADAATNRGGGSRRRGEGKPTKVARGRPAARQKPVAGGGQAARGRPSPTRTPARGVPAVRPNPNAPAPAAPKARTPKVPQALAAPEAIEPVDPGTPSRGRVQTPAAAQP